LTLRELLNSARARLHEAGVPDQEAALDADLFARTILGWDRARLIVESSASVPHGLEPTFSNWVERAARHEPVAYILGHREFWGLEFIVSPAVLIPRPETELIVEAVLEIVSAAGATTYAPGNPAPRNATDPAGVTVRVADIGTGSGNIAVSVAHDAPGVHVVATDVSSEALTVARQNAERHGVADRVEFFATSYLGGIEGDFDIIAANPPYVRELDRPGIAANVRHEPEVALFGGDDGLLHLAGVLDTAMHKLRPHGYLITEIGYGQEDDVIDLAKRRPGLRLHGTRGDLLGITRTILFQREAQ
jgi:release factor glutamine methyltransferase